jgi:hypothetical protein
MDLNPSICGPTLELLKLAELLGFSVATRPRRKSKE